MSSYNHWFMFLFNENRKKGFLVCFSSAQFEVTSIWTRLSYAWAEIVDCRLTLYTTFADTTFSTKLCNGHDQVTFFHTLLVLIQSEFSVDVMLLLFVFEGMHL